MARMDIMTNTTETKTIMLNADKLSAYALNIVMQIESSFSDNEVSDVKRIQNTFYSIFRHEDFVSKFKAAKKGIELCENGKVFTKKTKETTYQGSKDMLDQIKEVLKNNDNGVKSYGYYFWEDIYTGDHSDHCRPNHNPKVEWLRYFFTTVAIEVGEQVNNMNWGDIDSWIRDYYNDENFMEFFRKYTTP